MLSSSLKESNYLIQGEAVSRVEHKLTWDPMCDLFGRNFGAEKLLQPYCNRAGTDTYAVDRPSRQVPQNTCKIAQIADTTG